VGSAIATRPKGFVRTFNSLICLMLALRCGCALAADDAGNPYNPYNDPPPQQATHGVADCPPPKPRVLTAEQARAEEHSRIERGTACALAGTCEPGGAYKRDPEINSRVVTAIAADVRFADTSLWVETLRKFVTIKGCLRDADQGRELEALVRSVKDVQIVWQEAKPVDVSTVR
jgi:hypothetical protein